ncbi:MAG: 2-C-methyl-D-erythritol 4-phosphate cytidylyltransferase [Candidatus Krumholzibacteria bacterium]|nr:2-C-methyl-D-erythritol 4-phosphate cytidylyltransferase [Candidatus Krumholzibacteria bacterium]
MPGTDVLIMAAGRGERFAEGAPKQFMLLHGRPVIVWSIEQFMSHGDISAITVVTTPGTEEQVKEIVREHGLEKVDHVVAGGETRQRSVQLGLMAVGQDSSKVLVHDAVRPCFSVDLLQRILTEMSAYDAVIPAVPVVDTLVHERSGELDAILDRVNISGVQTPQGFRTDLLSRAHRSAEAKGLSSSDDGSLVFALGETVRTVRGESTNIKITFEDDVPIAEAILGARTNTK